jgi:hypothetical protein
LLERIPAAPRLARAAVGPTTEWQPAAVLLADADATANGTPIPRDCGDKAALAEPALKLQTTFGDPGTLAASC